MQNGLPTNDDTQKQVVATETTTTREEPERDLADDTGAVTAESGIGSTADRELPIPDYDELSVRGAKPRLDALSADELRRLRSYELEHKQRKTLVHEIDRRLR